MSRGLNATIAIAAFHVLLAHAVRAQESRWEHQVNTRLSQAATLVGPGYRAADAAGRGSLNTGESASFRVTLPGGAVLAAVCDDDCDQLDLSLLANGYETDAARGGGNAPIVRVAETAALATYRVTVHMASCHVNPCWYGVGVFHHLLTPP